MLVVGLFIVIGEDFRRVALGGGYCFEIMWLRGGWVENVREGGQGVVVSFQVALDAATRTADPRPLTRKGAEDFVARYQKIQQEGYNRSRLNEEEDN